MQCEGTLFAIAVAAVPHDKVYMDLLINGRHIRSLVTQTFDLSPTHDPAAFAISPPARALRVSSAPAPKHLRSGPEWCRIAPSVDRYSWLEHYAGMADDPGGLEAPFLLAFEHVPKKAYPNEAVFVTALVAGAGKADRSKLEAAALSSDGLYPSDPDRSADAKDLAVLWGMLRGTGAGGRAVAFLERSVEERDKAGSKPVLEALREAAIARGRVAVGETDEVVYAYATVHELAERVVAPPAITTRMGDDGEICLGDHGARVAIKYNVTRGTDLR